MRFFCLLVFSFVFLLCFGCAQVQEAECSADSDCVPASCCHAVSCVPGSQAPDCKGVFCTQECVAGTLDCGGSCSCEQGKCVAKNLWAE